MRSQMRLAAALLVLKRFTGVTPGRLFQMPSRRSAGQAEASSANSLRLAKVSKGVAVAAAASSGVPCAVMLFSLSIVNVIWDSPFSAVIAVITSIAPKCLKSKAILLSIDDGEGRAMRGRAGRRWRQVASDEGSRHKIRTEDGNGHRGSALPSHSRRGGARRRH